LNYSELAKKILEQKEKYWRKLLSQEAVEENIITALTMIDYYRLLYDLTIFDSIYSTIFMSLTFRVPLGEFSTLKLCYDVELPSPEEYARGKLLSIEQVHCFEKYPGMKVWLSDLFYYMMTHFGPLLALVPREKGYYDVSYYGYAYYDPAQSEYFIKSTALKESKRSVSGRGYAKIFKSMIQALNLDYETVDNVFTYLRAFDRAKLESALSEYSWSGKTRVQEEVEGKIPIPTEDLKGEEKEIRAYSLGNLWLDLLAKMLEVDITPIVKEGLPQVEGVVDPSKRADIAIADMISREQKLRLLSLPLLAANYQRAEERAKFYASRRADIYGASRAMYYAIKEMIDRELGDVPKFMRNQYNVAVQQLYARLTRDSGWGYEAYRTMTPEELKVQWIEEWAGKGLDREILERLFARAMQLVKYLGPLRAASKLAQHAIYSR